MFTKNLKWKGLSLENDLESILLLKDLRNRVSCDLFIFNRNNIQEANVYNKQNSAKIKVDFDCSNNL